MESIAVPTNAIRGIFAVAAIYDFLIGAAFLVAGPQIYESQGVTPPNHWAYVQFSALLLMIFGLMFVAVAIDPIGQRNLMRYGLLLKLAYCGLAGYHWFTADIPFMFKPFVVIDAIMYVLFLVAYLQTGKKPATAA